jgi:hypothetical protein
MSEATEALISKAGKKLTQFGQFGNKSANVNPEPESVVKVASIGFGHMTAYLGRDKKDEAKVEFVHNSTGELLALLANPTNAQALKVIIEHLES